MIRKIQFSSHGVGVFGNGPILLLSAERQGDRLLTMHAYSQLLPHAGGSDAGLRDQTIELYDQLHTSLSGYLVCLGLKPQEAEDIIQETFLKLFVGLSEGMKHDNLRAWLFRVAHNLAINLHKTSARLLSSNSEEIAEFLESRLDPALNPEEILLKKEKHSRILRAVTTLNVQQRHCLHLRAEGLRYREIADVLGVSIQRVTDIVRAALVNLAVGDQ